VPARREFRRSERDLVWMSGLGTAQPRNPCGDPVAHAMQQAAGSPRRQGVRGRFGKSGRAQPVPPPAPAAGSGPGIAGEMVSTRTRRSMVREMSPERKANRPGRRVASMECHQWARAKLGDDFRRHHSRRGSDRHQATGGGPPNCRVAPDSLPPTQRGPAFLPAPSVPSSAPNRFQGTSGISSASA